ncbi:hypothetical protein BDR26DRAFT_855750 [Obelidium mucronatum]|nr:hypothetical protein BDR26DRAFT_855750 [Obelidium mucronatum]
MCGSLVATTARDNVVRLFDARSSTMPVASSAQVHTGVKPSKVLWLGGNSLQHMLLTTGFSKTRDRECGLWDSRSMREPVLMHKVDSSTGSLIPLYDADSSLLFLTGKGDTSIRTFEISSSTLMQTPTTFVASRPINNAVLMKKVTLNVMDCEIARIMALSTGGSFGESVLTPISVSVARKSKLEFQSDLFPDTIEECTTISGIQWMQGENAPHVKVSLDPNSPTRRTVQELNLISNMVPFQEPPPERPSTPSGRVTPGLTNGTSSNRNSIGASALSTSYLASSAVASTPPASVVTTPIKDKDTVTRSAPRGSTPPAIRPKSINLANVVPVAGVPDDLPVVGQSSSKQMQGESQVTTAALEATISHLLDTKLATLVSHISLLQSPSPPVTPPETVASDAIAMKNEKLDQLFVKLDVLSSRMDNFESQLGGLKEHMSMTHLLLKDQEEEARKQVEASQAFHREQSVAIIASQTQSSANIIASQKEQQQFSAAIQTELENTRAAITSVVTERLDSLTENLASLKSDLSSLENTTKSANELLQTVDTKVSLIPDTLEVGLAKQTTSLVGVMDDIVKEQTEAMYAATSPDGLNGKSAAAGGENKRNSYRLPTVPNMGILNQVNKIKDLALNGRPGSSLGTGGVVASSGGIGEGDVLSSSPEPNVVLGENGGSGGGSASVEGGEPHEA